MSVVRILFLGTPEFAVPSLKALVEDDHFEVVGVVSQPDRPAGRKRQLRASPVKRTALELGLPVMTPEKIRDPEVMEQIREFKAEAAVVVAFGQILPQVFLDSFQFGAVNIHSSVLPRWRGAAPMQRGIMAGDTEGGVTLQKIVLRLDAGDVLGVRRVEIDENMNAIELHDRLKVLACELLRVNFMDYLRGNLAGKPQDESLVTHAAKLEKSEGLIDWSLSAKEIHNRVRGLILGPGSLTTRDLSGKSSKLKVIKTRVLKDESSLGDVTASAENGEIVSFAADAKSQSIVVKCFEGFLEILEVQPESKSKMAASDYIRGYDLKVGEVLGAKKS